MIKAIRASITALNLKFLIADILEEQRNPASTTFKRIYVHRANRMSKDLTRQNKGPKRIESSRPFNRRRRPDKGSSHNTLSKNDDDKAFEDAKTEFKSDSNSKLKSFTYVIKNFDLNDSKSNCFIGSLSSNNNVKDFETKRNYIATFNKSNKSLKQSPNRLDLLLYDINITDYIVNDRK